MPNFISDEAIVDPNAILGDNNVIMEGAIIRANVVIGNNNYIGPNCIIGDYPEKKGYFDRLGKVQIGNECRFTKQVTIDSGTEKTTIIHDYVIMLKNAHVGHDAEIHQGAILSCNSIVGGWSVIGKNTNLGLGAMVHQRINVPENCMIGMGAVVVKASTLEAGKKYAGVPVKCIGDNVFKLEY